VRAVLRELGATRIPRGRLRATRENPAGLTQRQVDVLALLATELTNSEIADRLVVSTRTVDHHVSAILTRLDVGTRRDAARRAAVLGLVSEVDSAVSV
jgi:DNA-binding NarL/FixJ family response regulator